MLPPEKPRSYIGTEALPHAGWQVNRPGIIFQSLKVD
jgi:hypothetical protein